MQMARFAEHLRSRCGVAKGGMHAPDSRRVEQGVLKASLLHMPQGNQPSHAKLANNGTKGLASQNATGA